MKLYYLVAVDVDERAIVDDNPPEPLQEAIQSEIKTNLDSVRGALGVVDSTVEPVVWACGNCRFWRVIERPEDGIPQCCGDAMGLGTPVRGVIAFDLP